MEQNPDVIQKKPANNAENVESSSSANSGLKPPEYNLNDEPKDDLMSKMENSFGADFSDVNIHTDAKAQESTNALNARAYTQKNDIYFNQNEYQPNTNEGRQLLGHELTHVIQQRAGRVQADNQLKGLNVNTNDSLEKEADDIGDIAAKGGSVKNKLGSNGQGSKNISSSIAQFKITPKKSDFYNNVGAKLVTGLMQGGVAQDKAYFVVAQVLQENGWDNEAPPGNNYFNIKGSNNGQSVTLNTHEEDSQGNRTLIQDEFRAYESLEESMADYLNLLQSNFPDAYDALYNDEKGISDFVTGLANGRLGRYATDLDYSAQVTTLARQVAREFGQAVPEFQAPEVEASIPAEAKKTQDSVVPMTEYDHLSAIVYGAMKGYGTDEERVYRALSLLGKDPGKIAQLKEAYQARYSMDLVTHIRSEFSNTWIFGNELDKALGFLNVSGQGESDTVEINSDQETDTGSVSEPVSDRLARVDKNTNDNSRVHNRWVDDDNNTAHTDAFNDTLETQIEAFFGEGYTREQVLQELAEARQNGDDQKAEEIRIKLHNANIYSVVEALDVENNTIHKPGGGKTYCNIYTYDMVTAMGGYIPRVWWTSEHEANAIEAYENGEMYHPSYKLSYKDGESQNNNIREMNANSLNAWLPRIGEPYFGWEQASSMKAGQEAANSGYIVIISAARDGAGSGHINVILPETEQYTSEGEGDDFRPLQSQAGSSNFAHQPHSSKWWNNSSHKNGGAWIYKGELASPIMTPQQMGGQASGGITATPQAGQENATTGGTSLLNKTEVNTGVKQAMVTASKLNVRPEPSTSQAATGQLSKGDVVNIVNQENGWAQLENGGYVSARYLQIGQAQTETSFDDEQLKNLAFMANNFAGNKAGMISVLSILKQDEELINRFKQLYQSEYGQLIELFIQSNFDSTNQALLIGLLSGEQIDIGSSDSDGGGEAIVDNGYDDNWPLRKEWTNNNGDVVRRKDKPDGHFGEHRGDHVHAGTDLNMGGGSADLGAPIYATHSGKVEYVKGITDDKNGAGNRISILSDDGSFRTRYFHMHEKPDFSAGDAISEGQIIGKVGGSGYGKVSALAVHLHYEVHVKVGGNWVKRDAMGENGILAPEDVQ